MSFWDGTRWIKDEPARGSGHRNSPSRPRSTQRKAVDWLATLVIILAVTLLLVPWGGARGFTPTIEASPSSGPAGSVITLSGARFQAGEAVAVLWDGRRIASATSDRSGALRAELVVPDGAAPGAHAIGVALERGEGRARSAVTEFVVTAAASAQLTPAATATASPSPTPAGSTPTPTSSPTPSASPSSTTPTPTPVTTDATPTPSSTPPSSTSGAMLVKAGQDLGRIANGAPDGAVIEVESGSYAPFVLTNSNLTIRAASGQTPVVSGGVDAIELQNVSGVTIEGLTVRGASEYGIDVRDSRNVRIHAVTATRNGTGIRISGWNSSNVSVTGSSLHTNDKMIRNTCGGNDDFGANGIKFHETNGPHSISGSVLYRNRAASCDYGTDGGAFEIWKASGITITNNEAYDNNVGYEIGTAGGYVPAGIVVRGNLFWHSSSDAQRSAGMLIRAGKNSVYENNTFRDVDWWVFFVRNCTGSTFCASIEGVQIRGNVVEGTAAYKIKERLPASVVIDGNRVSNPGGAAAEFLGTTYTSWLKFSQVSGYDTSTAR